MDANDWLAARMKEEEGHLRGVAYRMLGSLAEADDALQEAWIRLSRADATEIQNLRGWLTTVVARVCLDMLRSRKARREELGAEVRESAHAADPENELALADSIGLALLVVLETLPPAERIAFVLHDLFDLPFDEIAKVVDRSEAAARQLASRARRRVRGAPPPTDVAQQRDVVQAFLAAVHGGDMDALLAVLDPDIVVRPDATARRMGAAESRGAAAAAKRAMQAGARAARPALVDGSVGLVVAPRGRLAMVLAFTIANGKVVAIDAIADPERLRALDLKVI